MKRFLMRFLANEDGATAVEYALIGALISAALITVMSPVKASLLKTFETVANAMPQP